MSEEVTVYISGPMRGYPEFNFPAFLAAGERLRDRGYRVLDPAQRDLDDGFQPHGLKGTTEELKAHNFNLFRSLNIDLNWICQEVDAVVTLEGWEASFGACAEVSTARALGLKVMDLQKAVDPETVIEKVVRP